MATYTQGTITFNNVKTSGLRINACPIYISDFKGVDPDDGSGIINATNIDWNGAVLPNSNVTLGGSKTINTTGDLLELVNEMQKEIYVLSAAVIALSSVV